MTAPYDIVPKDESLTTSEMKLRKKGGWSKQYSAALAGNEGYSLWSRMAFASGLAIGSTPTPTEPNHGGGLLVWERFTDLSVHTLDNAKNYRDRHFTFIGSLKQDGSSQATWGTNLMQLMMGSAYPDNNTSPSALRPSGTSSVTISQGYMRGLALETKMDILSNYGAAGLHDVEVWPDPTTGYLFAQVVAPVSITYGIIMSGIIIFTPQTGYTNA